MTNHHVVAEVEPGGNWWLVTIPQFDIVGQAPTLDRAEQVAKELTALWLNVEENTIHVDVIVRGGVHCID